MSATFGKFRAALMKQLGNIGRTNGTAPLQSGNNVDPIMHELLVAQDGATYFDNRKRLAKQALLDAIDTTALDTAVSDALKANIGSNVNVYDGEVYSVTCDIKRPALRLDQTKLRTALIRKGMPVKEVDALFRAASDYSQPAKSYKVVMRGGASASDG